MIPPQGITLGYCPKVPSLTYVKPSLARVTHLIRPAHEQVRPPHAVVAVGLAQHVEHDRGADR